MSILIVFLLGLIAGWFIVSILIAAARADQRALEQRLERLFADYHELVGKIRSKEPLEEGEFEEFLDEVTEWRRRARDERTR